MNEMPKALAEDLAFTQKDLEELERAWSMPIIFGEDCSEVTPEMAVHFSRVNPPDISKKPAVHKTLLHQCRRAGFPGLLRHWCFDLRVSGSINRYAIGVKLV